MTARFLISLCISQAKKYIQMNHRLQNCPKYRLHNCNVLSFIKNVLETLFFSSSFVHSFFFLFFIEFMKERKKKWCPKEKQTFWFEMIGPSCTIVCNIWKSIKKQMFALTVKCEWGNKNETKTMNNPFYKHRFNKICIKYRAHHC